METALSLANGYFQTPFAKTTHGLVRGPCRYRLVGVVDATCAGHDAGVLLDGRHRDIPIFDSVSAMLAQAEVMPTHCLVGVATVGGVLPPGLYDDLTAAARVGMTLVNGLHQLLSDDAELVRLTREHGGGIIDIRKPKPVSELCFWSGEILNVRTPRVAVLGTDCALGKRTTCMLLRDALRAAGIRAEMIYTGQTGWLQGLRHGFIFDATLNDFVSGELERAVLECQHDTHPDLILLEGQSSLRNPSGPGGSEFVLSGGAKGVILQHAPARKYFEDMEDLGCEIPPLHEEIALIRLLGAEVWAVTVNTKGLTREQAFEAKARLAEEIQLPVALPLEEGLDGVVSVIRHRLKAGHHA
ncbi:MAG: DUF1611 domain-containing protein [Rhodothermales bacterium]